MNRTLLSLNCQDRDRRRCESAWITNVDQEPEANRSFMGTKQKQSSTEVPDASLPPHLHLHLASCSSFPPPPPSPGEPFEGLFHPLTVVIEQDSDVGWKISPCLYQRQSMHSIQQHKQRTHWYDDVLPQLIWPYMAWYWQCQGGYSSTGNTCKESGSPECDCAGAHLGIQVLCVYMTHLETVSI